MGDGLLAFLLDPVEWPPRYHPIDHRELFVARYRVGDQVSELRVVQDLVYEDEPIAVRDRVRDGG